jgi:hypothetical protein
MRTPEQLKAKYESILQEREKHSDQSINDFCKHRGIAPWTFYYWKKRLRKAPVCSPALRKFLPLQIMPSAPMAANGSIAIDYEIRFSNGSMMRLSGKMQREDISFIIRTVAGFQE